MGNNFFRKPQPEPALGQNVQLGPGDEYLLVTNPAGTLNITVMASPGMTPLKMLKLALGLCSQAYLMLEKEKSDKRIVEASGPLPQKG